MKLGKAKRKEKKGSFKWERESGWLRISEAEKKKIFEFGEEYKEFLGSNKTEREFVESALELARKNGFKNLSELESLKKGDKVFYLYKNKALILAKVGNSPYFKLVAAHVDSPRLDLKPHPLTEDSYLAFLKSHYYGGIKKYHWVSRPLALHGILITKKNKVIRVSIGEKEDDPVFVIADLLPHLAYKQMEKKMKEAIEGETLQILVGNTPIKEDKKPSVKVNVLKILHDEYGVVEEDLAVGELEFVPAGKPKDVGFDGSMIGGYGQDDRVCAYVALRALIDAKIGEKTALAVFVDKEEIGSVGNTSANSSFLLHFANLFGKKYNAKATGLDLLFNSKGISADVTGAINPLFREVYDPENSCILSGGVAVEKFGGGGGKYYSNDSSSEYFHEIRNMLNSAKVIWQTGELGRIDEGGGGTIAYILAKFGMDVIDMGPPLLGMHSPFEIVSKLDVFQTYKAYRAFYNEN